MAIQVVQVAVGARTVSARAGDLCGVEGGGDSGDG